MKIQFFCLLLPCQSGYMYSRRSNFQFIFPCVSLELWLWCASFSFFSSILPRLNFYSLKQFASFILFCISHHAYRIVNLPCWVAVVFDCEELNDFPQFFMRTTIKAGGASLLCAWSTKQSMEWQTLEIVRQRKVNKRAWQFLRWRLKNVFAFIQLEWFTSNILIALLRTIDVIGRTTNFTACRYANDAKQIKIDLTLHSVVCDVYEQSISIRILFCLKSWKLLAEEFKFWLISKSFGDSLRHIIWRGIVKRKSRTHLMT